MFYPILPSSQVYQEKPQEHLNTWHAVRNVNHPPTRRDYFLFYIGNLLIKTGQMIRSESAIPCCSDTIEMRVNPSGS